MFKRGLMTCRAFQRGVMGNHFLICNLTMTCAAVFRSMRQHRVVRLVTLRTESSGIVLAGDYLRKPGWSCRVVIMADSALIAVTGDFRLRFRRIIDMLFGRPMTNFASDVFMIRLRFEAINLIVTFGANLRSCILG